MIITVCIWPFLNANQDHFWYALSGLGSFGTLFIAGYALNTWRKEKEYDLIMENLAACNAAVEFIETLRYPASSSNEIKKEYLEELINNPINDEIIKRAWEAMAIYQSRRDRQQDIHDKVLKLREKNWAVYGEKHDFYLFFNRVVELDHQIKVAHIRYYQTISNKDEYSNEEFKAILKEVRPIMYSIVAENDPIEKELKEWITKLRRYRIKK